MSADATAASVYQGLVKNADPIGSFAAGLQLRMKLDAIQKQTQADAFQMTLDSVKMASDRSLQKQKMELANRELNIAEFNATTNRMNAQRAINGSGSSAQQSSAPMPVFSTGPNGEIMLSLPEEGDAQAPTSGEGDVMTPLQQGPETPRQMQGIDGNTAPLPTAGGEPENPLLPSLPGARPPSVPGGRVSYPVTSVRTGKDGRISGMTATMQKPENEKVITPDMIERYKALAEPFGQEPVLGEADANGVKKVTFKEKATAKGGDFSISSLTAEAQKQMLTSMTNLVTLAEQTKSPTDAQKMAAVGITDPEDMTPELWTQGYNKALGDPAQMDSVRRAAREHAAMLNLTFQGKTGYVPATEQTVLKSISVNPPVPEQVQTAKPADATRAPMASAANAPQPATVSKPQDGDEDKAMQQEAANLRMEMAAGVTPERKQLIDRRLEIIAGEMRGKQGDVSTSTRPPTTGFDRNTDAMEAQKQIRAKRNAVTPTGNKKVDESNSKWESNKQEVYDVMLRTADIEDLSKADAPEFAPPGEGAKGGGKERFEKWRDWLAKNRDKLKIKAMDNKPLTLNSPIFLNEDGKTIKLGDIIRARMEDDRTAKDIQTLNAQSNTTPAAKTFSQKAQSVLQSVTQ